MHLSVQHTTVYRYAQKVSRSTQYIRLSPCAGPRQRVIRWDLQLPARAVSLRDAFDNITHVLTLDAPYQEIRLTAQGSVDVADVDEGEPAGPINPMVFLRPTPLTEPDEALSAFVEPMRRLSVSRPLIALSDLMAAVLDRMPYTPGSTAVDHTAAQSFALGAGVCQDHTHVFLACCRLLGVPARYVSGYVHSPSRTEVASHAWSEVWMANRWVGFDISNGRHVGGGHLKLAIGLDYLDACPVRGMRMGGGDEQMSASACVEAAAQ